MKLPTVPEFSKEALEVTEKYLHEDHIAELVHRYNEIYLHWEELQYRKLPLDHEVMWNIIKKVRELKANSLEFGNWVFKYNLIDDFQEKLYILDKFVEGDLFSSLESLQDDRRKYLISSLMEEAIASSQIEGAVTPREIAKKMLQENRNPKNKSEKMIVNNYAALKHIMDLKNEIITPDKILEIQRIITKGTLWNPEYEGNFRDSNNVVVCSGDGTILHIPVEYSKISKLIEELCNFANSKDEDLIHPILKGIILHFLIGYLHPFIDGNGRTARALFYWYLLKNDYWIFEYMAVSRVINNSKRKYLNAYIYTETDITRNDSGDLTYFIKYNLDFIMEALYNTLEYLEREQKEQY
jgi:Fic family protein